MTQRTNATHETTDLVPAIPGYALMTMSEPGALAATFQGNLGTRKLKLSDLDVARVGRGGVTLFEIPGPGGVENVPTLTGVVVAYRVARRYWASALDDSGVGREPDCSSDDGEHGVGAPGGFCSLCPHAQWGADGTRPMCAERRFIYVLQEADLLPILLDAPPASIRNLDRYLTQLSRVALAFHAGVTQFSLERVSRPGGVAFARIVPRLVARLAPNEAARTAEYAAFWNTQLMQQSGAAS